MLELDCACAQGELIEETTTRPSVAAAVNNPRVTIAQRFPLTDFFSFRNHCGIPLNPFPGTAGVPPATSTVRCEQQSSNVLLGPRASRPQRAPSGASSLAQTQTFYCDRGRPARHEHRQVRVVSHDAQLYRLFAALSAGGAPAVPVSSAVVSHEAQLYRLFAALSAGGTSAVPVQET
jgi:hypothetical protein